MPQFVIELATVAVGGALGACLRHFVTHWTLRLWPTVTAVLPGQSWPLLIVNTAGSFVLGLLATLAIGNSWGHRTQLFLLTGLLGGFTTFSSFIFDVIQGVSAGHSVGALLGFMAQIIAGLLFCIAGIYCARYLQGLAH